MINVVELDCGHKLYLDTVPDTVDETLWCSRCGNYRELAPSVAKERDVWVINAKEDFRSMRLGLRKFIGECTVKDCDHSYVSWTGWFRLRDEMHQHYMNEHTRFGGIEITYADHYPPNSPPPF